MISAPILPTAFTPAAVAAYLDRIGYDGPTTPSLATLQGIYRAHLFNVPFENLDIVPFGRPLSLEPAALYDKIVRRHRGGFCYELNGLLGTMLRELGYDVTIVSVQFVEADGSFSPPFDHMALVVTTVDSPHPWLVDGAGGRNSTASPLPLLEGFAEFQADVQRGFRLRSTGDRWQLDEQVPGEDWVPEYTFQLIPRVLSDFADRCRYQEQDPESYFRQGSVCSLPTPSGRVTLSKDRLITTIGTERQEREVCEDEVADLLRVRFGIELSSDQSSH
ncbi:MAG: N-hydroxyarylamine O-acetyltransferase [Thermomicrobiales bacterium]|jgi:N-hydroxyarylamine O-acetyltransferase|nr:N-hydroxyarylamine O-acetyltransferase [Thermomicrobiales bacterium]